MDWSIIWAVIEKILGLLRSFLGRINPSKKSRFEIPKETLKILPRPFNSWWHMGSYDGKPAMQIVADFDITNITELNVMITSALLNRPKTHGYVMVRHPEREIYGRYLIPKLSITEGRVDFRVKPPVKKESELFKADVGFIDQFGNTHWVKGIEFKYS